MDIQAWGILTSILFVSSQAENHDQISQKFDLTSLSSPKQLNYATKEIVIYLTPRQIEAFKSNGAVVKFQSNTESEMSFELQQQDTGDQIDRLEEEGNKIAQQRKRKNINEEHRDSELTEILIATDGETELNEENIAQVLKQAQVDGKYTVSPIEFSTLLKNNTQQQDKYIYPSLKNQRNYSTPINQQSQKVKVRHYLPLQQDIIENKEVKKEVTTEAPVLQKIFKLIPSSVAPKSEEWAQQEKHKQGLKDHADKLNTLLLNHEKLVKSIGQRVYELVENEFQFQSLVRQLKASPNYVDQKFGVQIEKRKTNLGKDNSKSVATAKPTLVIKEEIITNNPEEAAVITPFVIRVPKPFEVNLPRHTTTMSSDPVPPPVVGEENTNEDSRNIYFQENSNSEEPIIPYEIQQIHISTPENMSIVRPVWEN